MIVVAVDPKSRKMAIVYGDSEPEMRIISTDSDDHYDRMFVFQEKFQDFFKTLDEFVLFIEQPLVGRGGVHTTLVLAQSAAPVVLSALSCGSNGVYDVNVGTWKKAIVGHGNASKDEVGEWLRDNRPSIYELTEGDQDLIDASCIWLYGQGVLARGDRVTSSSTELRGSS